MNTSIFRRVALRFILGLPKRLLRLIAGPITRNARGDTLDLQTQALLSVSLRLKIPRLHTLPIAQARQLLAAKNIEDASLEAELLLRHTLKINRAELYTDLNCELNPEQEKTYWQLIRRRLNGEPSAYITGHREFYGLDFYVNHSVLIPRPESELLVEKAIKIVQNEHLAAVADIGTGCGAIAISLALNLPKLQSTLPTYQPLH